ncbi:MAG TPA: hydantoinase B/oxoprolinase family protein, partial [Acetobacteraceae bacterium]|nr:hydantoinase B/oxoprolinase family protein [Acetobacteraceae bacterium]
MSIDPITLTVVWGWLTSITEEMGSALRRTAFSEAVREGQDFSTGLFDATGRLIAQGNFTPGHLGAMPYAVQNVLAYVPPERLAPGDMLATNDAALGGGHYPDMFLVAPVFDAGDIIGYVVTTAHHVDVGGLSPGSQAVQGVTEAYQEGIRILPVKLVHGGEFDPDLLRVILGNVRLPAKMRGDLLAQRNANHVGGERLRELFAAYGADLMTAAIGAIIERSEQRARELIGRLPEGTYSFDDHLDDYGPDTPPIRVAVDVTLKNGQAVVDFSRSSDQVPAALNCYLNYTRAYASFAIRVFAGIDLPNNAGIERVIRAVARDGCFFNAQWPAPCGGRAAVQVRIFEAINGALAQADPSRAMAAFSHWGNPNIGGIDRRTGQPWIMYDLLLAGYGGRADKDGAEALSPVMNCANVPVEVHETNNPIRVQRLELIMDSAGAGQFRGGAGLRKDIELLCDDAMLSLLGERHKFRPYGLFGGQAGEPGRTVLIRDGATTELGSKQVLRLRRGDVVSLRLAGA